MPITPSTRISAISRVFQAGVLALRDCGEASVSAKRGPLHLASRIVALAGVLGVVARGVGCGRALHRHAIPVETHGGRPVVAGRVESCRLAAVGAVRGAHGGRECAHGVYVGELSSATFRGASTVTGNGQRDISCNSPTSVTRGAAAAAGGAARTNCPNQDALGVFTSIALSRWHTTCGVARHPFQCRHPSSAAQNGGLRQPCRGHRRRENVVRSALRECTALELLWRGQRGPRTCRPPIVSWQQSAFALYASLESTGREAAFVFAAQAQPPAPK